MGRLKTLFTFFERHSEDAGFEAEFRACYQDPGVSHLLIGCAFAALTFGGFYLLDYFNRVLPLTGGVQSFRLLVLTVLAVIVLAIVRWRGAAVRHYTLLTNAVIFGCVQAAAYVAYSARIHTSYVEMYWALTASVTTATVVIFGYSRLTAYNTLLLVLTGAASAIVYALSVPGLHLPQLGRLVTHLVIANLVCFSLRSALESRERQLFLNAKENLRRNLHTKELEAAKRAAEQADEAKSRFLATMSHEIRTPMHAVLQIMDILGTSAAAEHRPLAEKGRAAGKALLTLLNGILDYSKVASGKATLRLSEVNLQAAVQTVIDLHAVTAMAKEVEVIPRWSGDSAAEPLLVDEVKFLEVVSNLVSNAIKFTERGFVEVSLAVEPARPGRAKVILTVRDTGIGISGEDQARLFTPFFQADSGNNRLHGGAGLGLAIVKGLVRLFGGSLTVASAPRVGTRVAVAFEAATATGASVSSSEPFRALPSESPAWDVGAVPLITRGTRGVLSGRVLLVEDNELNALLASSFLHSFGLEVVVAENGVAGLAQYQRGGYDLVLMDCQMPMMDGYETTRRIRCHEREHGLSAVPIVALTAVGAREKCLASGMDDCVAKPYMPDELFGVLEHWLALARLHADREILVPSPALLPSAG